MATFEKFGKHGYVAQSKVTPLIDYLEKGEIRTSKCGTCQTVHFPPRSDCPKCQGEKMTWVPMSNDCRLITFTEVHFSPPEFQKETPYLLGLAEMQHGLRVFAPISPGVQRRSLKPGLHLLLRPAKDGNGIFYRLEIPER